MSFKALVRVQDIDFHYRNHLVNNKFLEWQHALDQKLFIIVFAFLQAKYERTWRKYVSAMKHLILTNHILFIRVSIKPVFSLSVTIWLYSGIFSHGKMTIWLAYIKISIGVIILKSPFLNYKFNSFLFYLNIVPPPI